MLTALNNVPSTANSFMGSIAEAMAVPMQMKAMQAQNTMASFQIDNQLIMMASGMLAMNDTLNKTTNQTPETKLIVAAANQTVKQLCAQVAPNLKIVNGDVVDVNDAQGAN